MSTRDELAALLAEHSGVNLTAGWAGSPNPKDPRNIRRVCSCGEIIGQLPYPLKGQFRLGGESFDEPHRTHLAEVLAKRDAEVGAKVLRDASVRVSNERHTISGRLRANAELFALILWHEAEEIEWQQERAARIARTTMTTEVGADG